MNRTNFNELAALAITVTLVFPAASSLADIQDEDTSASAQTGIVSPAPSTDSVDGTGLRAVSDSSTESVDGTGLRADSDASTESVDGTGLRADSDASTESVDGTGLRAVSDSATESVDGTGGPLNVSEADLAASGERLLTVPASTRGDDCIPVGDAAAVDSSDCTPSVDNPDEGE